MALRRKLGPVLTYLVLIVLSAPILLGFLWLLITTFSTRTEGLRPFGWTLRNWSFLWESPFGPGYPSIWLVTLNTLLMSLIMTLIVVAVSSMTGYALSRMKFAGRKTFLSFTLILHAFPSVTLLIPIFFVLLWISKIPVIGRGIPLLGGFGYNTIGGVTLVLVAFQLPFGIWITKGFFDNISWDVERSAFIDGASRFKVWWQIMMPNIKPGLAALSIFSFLSSWSAYVIPLTFTTGGGAGRSAVLSLYLQNFISGSVMTNWNMVAAVGLFQLIPVVLFFFFTQGTLLRIYGGGKKGAG